MAKANTTETLYWTSVAVSGLPATSRYVLFQLAGAAGSPCPSAPQIHQGFFNAADGSFTDKDGTGFLAGAHWVDSGNGAVVGAWAGLPGGNTSGV